MIMSKKIRILVAKPGLDGHDRGAKIISLALRDAGMEVLYSGLHQSIDQIVSTAVQESVDIIGLSIMTGAHLTISKNLVEKLKSEGIDDMRIVVGGVIPANDIDDLKSMGIAEVFPNGTKFDQIIERLNALV
jgi:methylmalonyl-CoA mutase C-terminal domain/subunit